jgi:hypothetical protein
MKTKEEKPANGSAPRGVSTSLASLVISFLKGQGLDVYRIQSTQEAYEIKSETEVIRIYVSSRQ